MFSRLIVSFVFFTFLQVRTEVATKVALYLFERRTRYRRKRRAPPSRKLRSATTSRKTIKTESRRINRSKFRRLLVRHWVPLHRTHPSLNRVSLINRRKQVGERSQFPVANERPLLRVVLLSTLLKLRARISTASVTIYCKTIELGEWMRMKLVKTKILLTAFGQITRSVRVTGRRIPCEKWRMER